MTLVAIGSTKYLLKCLRSDKHGFFIPYLRMKVELIKNKVMSRKRNGLLAGLGIAAAGAIAYWKYKTMSAEEKQQLKSKVNEAGRKIKSNVNKAEKAIADTYEEVKTKAGEVKSKASKEIKEVTG